MPGGTAWTLAAVAAGAAVALSAAGCSSSGKTAVGQPSVSPATQPSQNANGAQHCSDPHPDPAALTFAAVVCVLDQRVVAQADGSQELKLRVSITNSDPNEFNVTVYHFRVLDRSGNDTKAEESIAPGSRTGAEDCIQQEQQADGWPLAPGKTFELPGPICYHLDAGTVVQKLVYDDDIPVALAQ